MHRAADLADVRRVDVQVVVEVELDGRFTGLDVDQLVLVDDTG